MNNKIYVVISESGEYEDYLETICKAFKDIRDAEKYKAKLEDEEQGYRDMTIKCRECAGLNKECPFYMQPYDNGDECDNYEPYHTPVYFRIDEIDYEE